ncbi:MAG: hypothetical protein WEG36_14515 [Gemmatimonadota bacterium]
MAAHSGGNEDEAGEIRELPAMNPLGARWHGARDSGYSACVSE